MFQDASTDEFETPSLEDITSTAPLPHVERKDESASNTLPAVTPPNAQKKEMVNSHFWYVCRIAYLRTDHTLPCNRDMPEWARSDMVLLDESTQPKSGAHVLSLGVGRELINDNKADPVLSKWEHEAAKELVADAEKRMKANGNKPTASAALLKKVKVQKTTKTAKALGQTSLPALPLSMFEKTGGKTEMNAAEWARNDVVLLDESTQPKSGAHVLSLGVGRELINDNKADPVLSKWEHEAAKELVADAEKRMKANGNKPTASAALLKKVKVQKTTKTAKALGQTSLPALPLSMFDKTGGH